MWLTAKLAVPLHALTSKGATTAGKPARLSDWSEAEDGVFSSEAPVLLYPRFDREFVLEVDASLQGLGACLSQTDDAGGPRPVAYASRGLRGAERNHTDLSSFKLQLLALKWAISEKCKPYTQVLGCCVREWGSRWVPVGRGAGRAILSA